MCQNKRAQVYRGYSWFVYSPQSMLKWAAKKHTRWICGRKKGPLQMAVFFISDVQVWWHKSFLSVIPPSSSCGLGALTPTPTTHHIITFLLHSQPCGAGAPPASHQRALPNTWRTTFINVTGLLPAVHFFLWVPQIHFSCSISNAECLVWPVPPQGYIHRISFKVLQCLFSGDMNYILCITDLCVLLSAFTWLACYYYASIHCVIVALALTLNTFTEQNNNKINLQNR